jgi:hypothetical protein
MAVVIGSLVLLVGRQSTGAIEALAPLPGPVDEPG